MRRLALGVVLAVAGGAFLGCGGAGRDAGGGVTDAGAADDGGAATDAGGPSDAGPPPGVDLSRDITHADLALDLTALTGTATLSVAPAASTAASFEVGGLTVGAVAAEDGTPLQWAVTSGRLDVGVPTSVTTL